MRQILSAVYFLSILIIINCDSEVETTHGRVVGRSFKTLYEQKNYHGFMGIPFAAPPVKELRFKPPQQIKPWDKVLEATKVKPACVQYNTNIRKGQRLGVYGLEDCLYLDIYTPGIDESKRPVIVFLYNENFKNSYNKTKDYAPDFFIEEDMLVVMISHRLSIFGFLSFEDVTLSGNAGLKDIVAALQWISNNIRNFGGDPERITLLGSQGGAAAIDLLIRSKAKVLFNSAILQSGTSLNPSYLQQNARERALKMAELLEIASSSANRILRELNDFPASKLLSKELMASPPDYYKENQRGILTFGPIVEKDLNGLVTEYPEKFTEYINVPVMIGFNSQEGLAASFKYLMEPHYLRYVEKDFTFLMPVRLKYRFDPLYDSYFEAIDEIKKRYFSGGEVTVNSASEYIKYMGDLKSYAMDKTVKMYANISQSSIYYYYFDYYSELNENKNNLLKLSVVEDDTWGAATADELCYLFKCPSLKEKYLNYMKLRSEEILVQKKIIKMWANFARYGNPTPGENNPLGNTKWPPYTLEKKEYLNIGKEIQVETDLLKDNIEFWDEFIRKWEKRAINGVVTDNFTKHDEL